VDFYVGQGSLSDAWRFERCAVTLNLIKKRRSHFRVGEWLLSSGSLGEVFEFGYHREPAQAYADVINRFQDCGQLLAAGSQDYTCEPFVLTRYATTVEDHQLLTLERYLELLPLIESTYLMPVIQGFEPWQYPEHIRMYEADGLLPQGAWVAVGSVCKRQGGVGAMETLDVFNAIHDYRPDLRLHAYGSSLSILKFPEVVKHMTSVESIAWAFRAVYQRGPTRKDLPKGWVAAAQFCEQVAQATGDRVMDIQWY
jgi:hypothetical protein